MTDTPADSFQRFLNRADVTGPELAWVFINLSGRHPSEVGSLDAILPEEVRSLVDERVDSAPSDEEGWREQLVIWPGFDHNDMKRAYRLGVEAVRAFRVTRDAD